MAERNWERVESSQINAISYDPTTRVLGVKFKANKAGECSVYDYANCDMQTYQAFKSAPSKGKFFGQSIKGNPDLPYRKVGVEPPEPALGPVDFSRWRREYHVRNRRAENASNE